MLNLKINMLARIIEINHQQNFWHEVAKQTTSKDIIITPNRRSTKKLYEYYKNHSNVEILEIPKITPLFDIDAVIIPELLSWDLNNKPKLLSRSQQFLYLTELLMRNLHLTFHSAQNLAKKINSLMIKFDGEIVDLEQLKATMLESVKLTKIIEIFKIIKIDWPQFLKEKNKYDFNRYIESKFAFILKYWQQHGAKNVYIAGLIGDNYLANNFIKKLTKQTEVNIIIPQFFNNHHLFYKYIDKHFNETPTQNKNLCFIENDNLNHEAGRMAYLALNNQRVKKTTIIICDNSILIDKIKNYLQIWNAKLDSSSGAPLLQNDKVKAFLHLAKFIEQPDNLLNLLSVIRLSIFDFTIIDEHIRNHNASYQSIFRTLDIPLPNLKINNKFQLNLQLYQRFFAEDISQLPELSQIFDEIKQSFENYNNYYEKIFELISLYQTYDAYTNFKYIKILTLQEALYQQASQIVFADFASYFNHDEQFDWLPQFVQNIIDFKVSEETKSKNYFIIQYIASNNHNILISNNLENEFYNLEMITNIFYRYNLIKFDHKLATYHQIYLENIKKSNYPKPTPKPDKQFLPKTLWSTDIEKLLKNPYEFYAKKILKLREKEPLFDLFDRRNFGIIIHQLLEKLAEKCKIKLISSQSQLTAFIYKFARQNLSTAYYHGWIERLLNLRPLFQELFVEANGTIDNEYIIKTTLNHIEIAAKIDYCLTNDRQISFIDYKTGALPTKNNIIMGFNCQLTIAALIALDNQITPEKISYLKLIGGDKLFQEIEINNPLLTELITNCRQGLNDIIELFYRQQAAFIAVPKNLHNHNYNQYDHLARTLEIFTD